MARRDLRRHKVRALLTCVLVALPVVVATVAALASYNSRWDTEREARSTMGGADAHVMVSGFTKVRLRDALWLSPTKAEGAERRDAADVDLATLLPQGSVLVPAGISATTAVPLASGGQSWVSVVDFSSDILDPLVHLAAGKAPVGPDDVALDATTADQLGLLGADGAPTKDARVDLADGSSLAVVGVVTSDSSYDNGGLTLVTGPDTRLLNDRQRTRLARSAFVDLPDLTSSQLHDLARDLAATGVMMQPRDAIVHPEAWHLGERSDVDVTPILVGALCILVGLLEVVLLVGAAFAVAARRQVRDLGLLAANGGAGGDVRRVLLAQGIVLGIGSSLVGVAAGLGVFRVGIPLWEGISGSEMWRQEIDWRAVIVIAVLGSLTSVAAALLPGWNVGRLTPVAALSGRFPVRSGESKAHRGAFVLAGLGLLLVAGGGWMTARAFAPRASESPLGAYLVFLGLVLMVAGTVWATPYVVRQAARSGQALPLAGRYAFRDAGRHRFRSAAATMALTITIGGAVLAGFGFSTAARAVDATGDMAANTMTVSVYDGQVEDARLARVEATVEDVVGGDLRTLSSSGLQTRDHREVTVDGRYSGVASMSEDDLAELLGPGSDEALAAFRDGSVVLVDPRRPTDEADLVVRPRSKNPDGAMTLPAVSVSRVEGAGNNGMLGSAFVSPRTAEELGLRPVYGQMLVHADQPFTQDMIDRLRVYGIDGYSYDPERSRVDLMQFSGLAAAGLLSALVVGVAVALAAAESRDDVATLAAVGAGPWRRRSLGAMHGLFLALVGCVLGLAVGLPTGLAFTQLDGASGVDVPWLATAGTLAAVLVMAPLAGWVVTPSRLSLTRRAT